MRRMTVLIMSCTLPLSIIAGIAELSPQHIGPPVLHILIAAVFTLSCLVHIWVNRKAMLKYIRDSKQRTVQPD
jgi:hypothetical protein